MLPNHLPPLTGSSQPRHVGNGSLPVNEQPRETGVTVQQLYEDTRHLNNRKAAPLVSADGDTHVIAPVYSQGTRPPSRSSSIGSKIGSGKRAVALSPKSAVKQFMSKLSAFELQEVYSYQEVFFVGPSAKKVQGSLSDATNNNGYDDEQGSYIYVPHDHVAYRYEVLKIIGKGSFGQVVKAYDHKIYTHVALKMVRNEKRFHKQAQEEIRILEFLKRQDREGRLNIVHIHEHFTFRNHICITFELLNVNLYELIKRNRFQGFSVALVRKFAHSILQCLDVLHRNRIIHCDLKPENILLKQAGRSGIKVIDFGSSCYEHQRIYTYIQSRFYRAPEVILGARYGLLIDMWSFGCILAELHTGYPLFPGEDESDQLACIIEMLGMPSQKVIDAAKRAQNFISSRGHPRYCTVSSGSDGNVVLTGGQSRRGKYRGPPASKSLASALKDCDDSSFVDFMCRCLDWDPTSRLTAPQALRHDWMRRRQPAPSQSSDVESRLSRRSSYVSSAKYSNGLAAAKGAGGGGVGQEANPKSTINSQTNTSKLPDI